MQSHQNDMDNNDDTFFNFKTFATYAGGAFVFLYLITRHLKGYLVEAKFDQETSSRKARVYIINSFNNVLRALDKPNHLTITEFEQMKQRFREAYIDDDKVNRLAEPPKIEPTEVLPAMKKHAIEIKPENLANPESILKIFTLIKIDKLKMALPELIDHKIIKTAFRDYVKKNHKPKVKPKPPTATGPVINHSLIECYRTARTELNDAFDNFQSKSNEIKLLGNQLKAVDSKAKSLTTISRILDDSNKEHPVNIKRNTIVVDSPTPADLNTLNDACALMKIKLNTLNETIEKVTIELSKKKLSTLATTTVPEEIKVTPPPLAPAKSKKIEKDIQYIEKSIARLEKKLTAPVATPTIKKEGIEKPLIKEKKNNPVSLSQSKKQRPNEVYRNIQNLLNVFNPIKEALDSQEIDLISAEEQAAIILFLKFSLQVLAYNVPLGDNNTRPKFRNNASYNLDHMINESKNPIPTLLTAIDEHLALVHLHPDERVRCDRFKTPNSPLLAQLLIPTSEIIRAPQVKPIEEDASRTKVRELTELRDSGMIQSSKFLDPKAKTYLLECINHDLNHYNRQSGARGNRLFRLATAENNKTNQFRHPKNSSTSP